MCDVCMFRPKSARTWFLFSETSFEKQCHNGLTEFVQLERVASRRRQSPLDIHHYLACVVNWHVLNVAKSVRTAEQKVSCNVVF